MIHIDISYRPSTYFLWLDHGVRLASDIPGVARRRIYEKALAENATETAKRMIEEQELSRERRALLGSVHPFMMGGEYLPRRQSREVEIARIVIASTTHDTFCMFARRSGHRIVYRVVDEYEGECLDSASRTSVRPLSLGDLCDFFLTAWNLWQCLEANFADHGYPPDRVHGFIVDASSTFYADFGLLIEERIDAWVTQKRTALGLPA